MDQTFPLALIIVLIALALAGFISVSAFTKLRKSLRETESSLAELQERFAPVINIEAEVYEKEQEKIRLENQIEEIRASYRDKRQLLDNLLKEVAIYDEQIESAELGFYKPHFSFDTPEKYKEEIQAVRSQQKELVSKGGGIYCRTEWTVEGSRAKGKALAKKAVKITARAFNNECDAAIASVSWNNIQRMEQRIQKAFDSINKLNETNQVVIDPGYLNLKLQELQLAFEYVEKKQTVKEEQAELRSQMREEAKLEQEKEQAMKEEERFTKLLTKAKEQVNKAAGDKLAALNDQIAKLDEELRLAHEKSERALSMAQQTKSGHVYVISNIGSFGKDVYKIGMTRRLEPLDRVKELGDASVPFIFDVHAMIYCDDAPGLESTLHRVFDERRLNLVNTRKEFFHVTLDEIKHEALKLSPEAEFIITAEARDYRESLSIIAQRKENKQKIDISERLPETI
jgi:cell shape-determining protein MreC